MSEADRDASRRAWAIGVACLVALHLATRLHDLASWAPLLNDESIEVHRALLIASEPRDLWLPNVELKPPLFYWLAALLVRLVPEPVLAVRLLSVAGGVASLALVLHVARALWNRTTALAAGAVLVASPLALLYERTGYVEPLLGAFSLAALSLALAMPRSTRDAWLHAVLMGVVLGVMLLLKQTALLFAPFFPLRLALSRERRDLGAWARLGLSLAIAGGFVALLVLAPDVPSMWGAETASTLGYHRAYVMPLAELASLPIGQWSANVAGLAGGLSELLTPALAVATVLAAGWLVARRDRGAWTIALWVAIPLAVVAVRAARTEGRTYLVAFVAAPFAMLAGRAAVEAVRLLRTGWPRTVLPAAVLAAGAVVVSGCALARDGALLLRPQRTLRSLAAGPLAKPELSEERVADAAAALRELGRQGPVLALVDLSFGMPGDGLAALLWGEPSVRVVFAWWIPDERVPVVPDGPVDVHRSAHHRTLPPETWSPETFGPPASVYWVVNSLRWPAEAVRRRAPGAVLAFSLRAADGSAIEGWRVAPLRDSPER